ncbi:MAG: bis(5'-nucleosyl)-tetraphosphatase (symmetrical) YqeK [Firmicutes bacterium]|nr:bis(5'-nucleosyl)-tetraphosphatase (symmetrical) YqeK [Bacillota bacterium]
MRIGIFGGAFDPLHGAHIELIEKSASALNLARLVIVPSFNPPHKELPMLSYEKRVGLLRAFFGKSEYAVIDEIEREMNLKHSFSYLTLPNLVKKYGEANEYYYLMGADSLINFGKWAHPEIIAKYAVLAVAGRKGYEGIEDSAKRAEEDYGAKVEILNFECGGESSTDMRKILNKLKKLQSPELYKHSERTLIYAMRFAKRLNLSYESVFIASILHDTAKEMPPQKDKYPEPSLKIRHQFDGRVVARTEFGISDNEVLDAIEYHTTGKPEMTNLGKLVYVADKLECGRDYENINNIRVEIERDFESGFLMLLKQNALSLKAKGVKISGLAKETLDFYGIIED